MNENKIYDTKVKRIGVPDKFIEQYDLQETLFKLWKNRWRKSFKRNEKIDKRIKCTLIKTINP